MARPDAVERAIVAIASAVRPGGLFAIDVCDLEWAAVRQGAPGAGKIGDDWAIAVEFSIPAPDRFVRDIATFLRNEDGTWRRSDERHETLPTGLRVLIGWRPPVPQFSREAATRP